MPKKIIPFTIDPGVPNKERITAAIKHWEDNTEFHFVKKGADGNVKHNNFISFEDKGGSSQIQLYGHLFSRKRLTKNVVQWLGSEYLLPERVIYGINHSYVIIIFYLTIKD